MPAEPLDADLPGEPEAKPVPVPKKVPAAAVSPPVAEPPQKHTHSRKLVEVATHFGISQEDLDDYPSADIWEEVHRLQMLSATQPKPVPSPPGRGTDPQGGGEGLPAEDEFDTLLADPNLDPRWAKVLKKQRDDLKSLRERDTERTAKIDVLEKAEQQRAVQRVTEVVDAAFAALPAKYHALVGTEGMAELTDPGERGWRGAIYARAKIDHAKDSPKTIAKKIAEAAAIVAAGKVASEEPDDDENLYAAAKPKKAPAKDPVSGRFTADDFERGTVARPSGKKPHASEIGGVEAIRQHFVANGDARGSRNVIDPDDTDDLPG